MNTDGRKVSEYYSGIHESLIFKVVEFFYKIKKVINCKFIDNADYLTENYQQIFTRSLSTNGS
jgi:hypothetical protein